MADWWVDEETGLPSEKAVKIRQRLAEMQNRIIELENENAVLKQLLKLSDDGVIVAEALHISNDSIKPLKRLSLGNPDSYFADVVTTNITIPSKANTKTQVREIDFETFAATPLPPPKQYIRDNRTETGFIAEELPPTVKTPEGHIDFKALITLLAAKIMQLEKTVYGGGSR